MNRTKKLQKYALENPSRRAREVLDKGHFLTLAEDVVVGLTINA